MNKRKIFTGTFYPLKHGEIMHGYDHYNHKLPLTKDFDIKFFCYNSSGNKTEIITRQEDGMKMPILRFDEQLDDMRTIVPFFDNVWTPDVCNFHGGNSGNKGTAREIIEHYKSSSMKFGLECGGGYDKQSMLTHYYNERADYVILNHYLWKDYFPTDYQNKIFIYPKNQSVDTNIFHPLSEYENNKPYDVIMVGRYDGGNKGHGILYNLFNNTEVKVLLKGADIPNNFNTSNITVEAENYNHVEMNKTYNSAKIFIWATPKAIETPLCIVTRVIAEAVAAGLPMIAFKDSFIESDIILNEQNGFLVNSERELLEKTRLLLNDEKLYKQMSDKSLEIAQDCKT
jgi:hypothetical protein